MLVRQAVGPPLHLRQGQDRERHRGPALLVPSQACRRVHMRQGCHRERQADRLDLPVRRPSCRFVVQPNWSRAPAPADATAAAQAAVPVKRPATEALTRQTKSTLPQSEKAICVLATLCPRRPGQRRRLLADAAPPSTNIHNTRWSPRDLEAHNGTFPRLLAIHVRLANTCEWPRECIVMIESRAQPLLGSEGDPTERRLCKPHCPTPPYRTKATRILSTEYYCRTNPLGKAVTVD